jgi:hypothetical protein
VNKEELLRLLREQLDGLAKSVESDKDFATNKEDYNVTIKSIRKRIAEANKLTGNPPMASTKTGRWSSKNPNTAQVPKTQPVPPNGPIKEVRPRHRKPNRRAAIEHTRKLNESLNDS